MNRITQITNPLNHTISFTYDSRGQVTYFTDANNHTTQWQYDGNGNVIKQINALNQ